MSVPHHDHWLEVVSSASKTSSVSQLTEEAPLDNSLILLSDMLHYVYINQSKILNLGHEFLNEIILALLYFQWVYLFTYFMKNLKDLGDKEMIVRLSVYFCVIFSLENLQKMGSVSPLQV